MSQSQVVVYQTVPNTTGLCDPLPIPVDYSSTVVRQELGTGVRGGHQHVTARLDSCPRRRCFMEGL